MIEEAQQEKCLPLSCLALSGLVLLCFVASCLVFCLVFCLVLSCFVFCLVFCLVLCLVLSCLLSSHDIRSLGPAFCYYFIERVLCLSLRCMFLSPLYQSSSARSRTPLSLPPLPSVPSVPVDTSTYGKKKTKNKKQNLAR